MSRTGETRVLRLSARQHALVTRKQALQLGMRPRAIDRRVECGRWEALHPRVYRVNGAPSSWNQLVLAACLAAGEGAAASHVTAGVLWGLIRTDPTIEVTVPFGKHPRTRKVHVHRSRLGAGKTKRVGGIPVTSPARTLLDLATVIGIDELEEAVDEALRRRLVAARELHDEALELARRGRRGAGKLARLVGQRVGGPATESVLETRFLRALREAALPLPQLQHEIRRGERIVARLDFAYLRERIAIELDGHRDHSSRKAFERDRVRQNHLVQAGWTPLRFTWADLGRPRYVSGVVRRMLLERGHPDVASP